MSLMANPAAQMLKNIGKSVSVSLGFYKETGVWIYNSVNSLLNESRDLFKDIIESPDKVNDCYENLAYDFLESKYLTIKQSGSKFSDIKHKGFSILHCNIRSLSKNLTLLTDVLLAVKELPNIIAITETKLTENSQQNINIFYPVQYITRTFRDSFMFRPIDVHEVRHILCGLKINKSTIDIPQKCIKLAAEHISEALTSVFNV